MTYTVRLPVVVGVDGSPAALAAVDLAALEASRRRIPLRIVYADWWRRHPAWVDADPVPGPPDGPGILCAEAARYLSFLPRQILTEARTRAGRLAVPVSCAVVTGSPVRALVRESTRAALIVVCRRGLGAIIAGAAGDGTSARLATPSDGAGARLATRGDGTSALPATHGDGASPALGAPGGEPQARVGTLTGRLIGSVAVRLAGRASCPLLIAAPDAAARPHAVARPGAPGPPPVLVGVDATPGGDAALGFAFEEAALCGAPLLAVHAWSDPIARPAGGPPALADRDDRRAAADRALSYALAPWQDTYPKVLVRRALLCGDAADALVEVSAQARLAVVGTRGRSGAGLPLGGVTRGLLRRAGCPVAVVRRFVPISMA